MITMTAATVIAELYRKRCRLLMGPIVAPVDPREVSEGVVILAA